DPIRVRGLVFDGFRATRSKPVIPAVERRWLDPEHLQRSPSRQMRLLDEADDLKLLRCGEPHVWSFAFRKAAHLDERLATSGSSHSVAAITARFTATAMNVTGWEKPALTRTLPHEVCVYSLIRRVRSNVRARS